LEVIYMDKETIARLGMGLGGVLFAVEGVLKLCGVQALLGMTTPCGLAMILLGGGALLHAMAE
jgi:hypothetical protein